MTTEHPDTGQLLDMTASECWDHAASRPVGRLAWQSRGGPVVIPVNFLVDGHSVRIRTAAYSAMAREVDDSPVAFEVDEIDETSHTGWSVLFRGHAHVEYHGGDGHDEPDVWASGVRGLHVRIDVDEVTGRWIQRHD